MAEEKQMMFGETSKDIETFGETLVQQSLDVTPSKEEENKDEIKEEVTEEVETEESEKEEEETEETKEKEEEEKEEEKEISPVIPKEFIETLKKVVPEDYEVTEENAIEVTLQALEELKEYYDKSQESNKILVNVLTDNPELQHLIADLNSGADLKEAIMRSMPDIKDYVVDTKNPDYEKWEANKKNRAKLREQEQEMQEKIQNNLKQSLDEFSEFAKKTEMDEKESKEFLSKIDMFADEITQNKFSKELFEIIYNGITYKDTIEKEVKKAETKAKAEKLKETKTSKGDGLPHINKTGEKQNKLKLKDSDKAVMQIIDNHLTRMQKFGE